MLYIFHWKMDLCYLCDALVMCAGRLPAVTWFMLGQIEDLV